MAQPTDLIGKRIDNYTIQKFLARGGMADVYLARHTGLQRDVALKILLPSYVENPAFVERFRREAQAMARLQHPNIVQVYDTGDTPDGRPYIAMQYVRGGTLEDLLARLETDGQIMTAPYALAIARQVASALQTAHAADIVHRDLKPSNILLDESGKPLLTDLGIAFMLDNQRLTRTDTFLGTPHYMSPEQGKGAPPDARSDIYSLGIVLFEMLAGARPFHGESHWALIHQHISEQPPSLGAARPDLAKASVAVVDRCLQKDPARRYRSAAELAAALDRALVDEGSAGAMTASGQWQWRPRESGAFFMERAGRLRSGALTAPRRSRTPLLIGLGAPALLLALGFLLFRNPAPRQAPAASPAATPPPSTVIVEVIVEVTSARPTSTVMAAVEQTPTDAATATLEPPPTAGATATSTRRPAVTPPAPGRVVARIARDVWTREGPGLAFPIAGSLSRDAEVVVLGRDSGSAWFLVKTTAGESWVPSEFITDPSGTLGSVALAATIPAPPTPTPVPPTATPAPSGGGGGGGGQPPPEQPTATSTIPPPPED